METSGSISPGTVKLVLFHLAHDRVINAKLIPQGVVGRLVLHSAVALRDNHFQAIGKKFTAQPQFRGIA